MPWSGRLTWYRRPGRSRVSGSRLKPVAMTTPNPVRRPSSATISPVRASETPCGAAITMPRRPILPASAPGRPSISGRLARVAQPERTMGPIAKLIAHQNRLRERIFPFVGQREQYPAPTLEQPDLLRLARQHERRRLGAFTTDLELAPVHTELQPGAQRLEPSLLGGKARREVRRRIPPRATVRELVLEGGHALADAGDRVDRRLGPDGYVDEHLGKLAQAGRQRSQRLARLGSHAEQRERREDPVPRGGVVEEQHVAGLLAAEIGAEALHFLEDVAVPDLRLDHADPRGLEGLVEAQVGHDRGNDEVLLQPLARRQMAPRDHERVVPIADLARVVDRDEPVAVAVERKADRRAAGTDLPLEVVGVERAAPGADVGAVGPHTDRDHLGAETPEHAWRDAVSRAVGAVAGDREAAQVERRAGAQEVDVHRLRPVVAHQRADLRSAGAGRAIRALEPLLDVGLPRVRKLGPLGREELDAVVLERIVRGAEHDATVSLEATREHRDAGGGQHTDGVTVGAGGQAARDQCPLEERARATGVPSDDESHPVSAVVELERCHELAAHTERKLGRERLFVRHAPDPVGAEQARHWTFTGFATAAPAPVVFSLVSRAGLSPGRAAARTSVPFRSPRTAGPQPRDVLRLARPL